MTGERALWAEVLMAALRDLEKGRDAGWIGSRDFHMVCALAGIDAEAVDERFDRKAYVKASRAA